MPDTYINPAAWPPSLQDWANLIGKDVKVTLPKNRSEPPKTFYGTMKKLSPTGAFCVLKPDDAPQIHVPLADGSTIEKQGRQ